MKIAQFGAGRIGALHAANAARNPRVDLAYIVDPLADAAAALARNVGASPATAEAVLDDPTIMGVIIASSTDAHLDDAIKCLRAGKAVFCEKPLDLAMDRLLAAAEIFFACDTPPLFVAFNRRFDPHLQALKTRLDQGEIGEIETLHIINHDPAPPALDFIPRSGGLFKDFTIHDFDLVRWLTGDEVVEVFALASCLIDPQIGQLGDVDTAKTILRTAGGKLCVISNSRRTGYGYDQRIEAFGAKGALRVDNVTCTTTSAWREDGSHADAFAYGFQDRYHLSYHAEMEHFADILAGTDTPRTGYADSVAALALAEAAALSMRDGKTVKIAKGAVDA